MTVIHDAALREDELRGHGANRERIASDWAQRYGPKLARLAISDPTVEYAFPPEPDKQPMQGLTKWAQDLNRKMEALGDEEGRLRDWGERQYKDD
jgi:hypothetical protein